MTKTTTYSKTICRKCNPYTKHKQQNEIANYIKSLTNKQVLEDNRTLLNGLELDIVVDNIAIEFNGMLSHSKGYHKLKMFNNLVFDKNYHLDKTELCESKGFQLFHIFESEWQNPNIREIWKSVLSSALQQSRKIGARECNIKELTNNDVKEFLKQNHLQGYHNSSIILGLFYNNELVSVMTFSTPRTKKYQTDNTYEMIRYCSKKNLTIQGGASRLLKYFERKYSPKSIISYANRRWSEGQVYEKLGFEFTHNAVPNFWYFKPNDYKMHSRHKFQKHKLKELFSNYNENKTAEEMMLDNGYRKIYDSGNKVYVKMYN